MNYMLVAEDNNYPKKGGIAALVGIYPTQERAKFIQKVVELRNNISKYIIIGTESPLTELVYK